jgi:hypothetical protein
MADFFVSGQVTIRGPRYFEKDRTSCRMPNQKAAATTTTTINVPTAVFTFLAPFRELHSVRVFGLLLLAVFFNTQFVKRKEHAII